MWNWNLPKRYRCLRTWHLFPGQWLQVRVGVHFCSDNLGHGGRSCEHVHGDILDAEIGMIGMWHWPHWLVIWFGWIMGGIIPKWPYDNSMLQVSDLLQFRHNITCLWISDLFGMRIWILNMCSIVFGDLKAPDERFQFWLHGMPSLELLLPTLITGLVQGKVSRKPEFTGRKAFRYFRIFHTQKNLETKEENLQEYREILESLHQAFPVRRDRWSSLWNCYQNNNSAASFQKKCIVTLLQHNNNVFLMKL